LPDLRALTAEQGKIWENDEAPTFLQDEHVL